MCGGIESVYMEEDSRTRFRENESARAAKKAEAKKKRKEAEAAKKRRNKGAVAGGKQEVYPEPQPEPRIPDIHEFEVISIYGDGHVFIEV